MEEHLNDERLGVALRAEIQAAAARPEDFWRRQQAEILARLEESSATPRPLAWASATAALLALAVLLSLPGKPPVAMVPQPDPDSLLLMEVQNTLDRNVPDALAPASLLTQEMSQALESKAQPQDHSGRRTE